MTPASVVVVLGAAGFIGRHVCLEFARQGHTVLGIGHGTWSAAEAKKWGVARWLADDIGVANLAQLVSEDRPAAIVHCAGSGAVSFAYAAPFDDYRRAVLSMAAALEYVRLLAPAGCRVVLASSAAVYGDQGDVDLSETSTRSPISPYGFNKLAAEDLCDSYSRFFGVQTSTVRLFSVYGEGLRKQLLWDAMKKFERGENTFFGTGRETRDWLHVDDAAALLCRAALQPQAAFEVYNGGCDKATTREVLTTLGSLVTPARVPQFNGETHAGNPRRLTANASHAQRQLGWTPQLSLGDGLARYARWFSEAARQ